VLTQRGEDFIRIDGQTPSKERHARVQQFQNTAQCRVGVLAITAAGIALTLTAASTVYFAELFWTPAALLQVRPVVNIVVFSYRFLSQEIAVCQRAMPWCPRVLTVYTVLTLHTSGGGPRAPHRAGEHRQGDIFSG
jgi:hypothetical protein